jgi:hypothetical protein
MALPLGAVLRSNELFGQTVELPVCLDQLSVDEFKPLCHGLKMGGRRSDRARRNRNGRRPQSLQNLRRIEAPNAVLLQQALKRFLPDTDRFVRYRHQPPQIEKPVRRNVIGQLQHLRIVTPELLADAITESIPFCALILSDPRPLSQFDHNRVERCDRTQTVRISPERVSKHLGITAVILGARRREAVSEAIELLWIDGVDTKAASIKLSTTGPCGTSIATYTSPGSAPVS